LTLIIKPKSEFEVCVEAEITPEIARNLEDAKNFKVYLGKEERRLEELFDLEFVDDREEKVILKGDFSRVKWIGREMKGGEIIVEGNVGMHLGAFMEGGRIVVKGNCDDWVGGMMKGGEIVVEGDTGNRVGCNYWGESEGMKGGRIVIKGNAGNYIGEKMVDGEIVVEGNAGDFVGSEMKGGKIVVRGKAGYTGWDMKGGVIEVGECELSPSFVKDAEGVWRGDVNVKGEGVVRILQD